jgi:hypothetical protein
LRFLHIWFLGWMAVLLAIPAVGLAYNTLRVMGEAADVADGAEIGFAKRFDRFVATHVGLREDMVDLNRDMKALFAGGSRRVAVGSDGWLFLTDLDVFGQVTGQRYDVAALTAFVDVAAELRRILSDRPRRLLVAIAPNKHTIYRDRLPVWAREVPARTELDALHERLHAEGIEAVDLRPALQAWTDDRLVYWRGDTHWTPFGAAVAFNEIARTLGHSDAAVDLEAGFGEPTQVERAGDLVAILQSQEPFVEFPSQPTDPGLFSEAPFERTVLMKSGSAEIFRLRPRDPSITPPARPKVLVIGDSFTVSLLGALSMRFASEFTWMPNRLGVLDADLIREIDPDIVILETVERTITFFQQGPGAGAANRPPDR